MNKDKVFYKGYWIEKTTTGYRVKLDNSTKHTHLKNFNPCKKMIDNITTKSLPKGCGLYYIESHIRLATDEEYKRHLQEYLEIRKQKGKKDYYYNPNKVC